MGELIHHADEVIVISHYTYGGFSGFVKNVFDRSLGYVLPQFEVVNGESHHRKRYEETRLFTFIFLGHNLSTEEKDSAVRYVNAVIANIRGQVKSVEFRECEEQDFAAKQQTVTKPGRTVLLIGSMRSERGNSAKLAAELNSLMDSEAEILPIKDYLGKTNELCSALESAEKIVLCTPLYVDGLPAQVIRFMEDAEKHLSRIPRKVYVLANMGLYESSQMANLFATVKQWCGKMNQDYCGGLGISAGELIGTLMDYIPFRHGPSRNASAGMFRLSDAVRRGTRLEVISAEPFCFPRFLIYHDRKSELEPDSQDKRHQTGGPVPQAVETDYPYRHFSSIEEYDKIFPVRLNKRATAICIAVFRRCFRTESTFMRQIRRSTLCRGKRHGNTGAGDYGIKRRN